MTEAMALLLATILGTLAAVHVYWAAGGRWGIAAALPQRVDGGAAAFSPGSLATVSVALLLLIAALAVLAAAELVALPVQPAWTRAATWMLAAVFLVRAIGDFRYVGFFKRNRGTHFARWDSRLHSPLCLVMAGLALGVALGTG